jgi:aminoglycoside phosphotransferase (APT) family kinase protein
VRLSDSLLDQLLDILEQLHAIGRKLGVQRIIAPGIAERSKRLNDWTAIEIGVWNQQLNTRLERIATIFELEVFREVLGRTLDRLHRNATSIRSHFQRMLDIPVDCHWVIRDLWRENILVEDERVSGIIDFGASRIDWPDLEIVRMLGSMLEPNDPRITKYYDHSPSKMSGEDFRFLDHSATLLSLLQWLHWICFADISFEGRENRVRSRVVELNHRLSQFP